MDLADLTSQLKPVETEALNRAEAMRALLDSTVAAVRRIAMELRPLMLDDLGLIATIEWLASDFSARTGIKLNLDLPETEMALDPEVSTALFRVLQESLTNVARHSGADRVEVKLMLSASEARLRVRDNGSGFDAGAPAKGATFGLLGMRERAKMHGGELVIESSPRAGTSILMIVPRSPAKPAA
ncbi:MAG: hypothetical protein C5B46_00490 [Proteobacteria bacterium]|nr:MAG: hypothetical protein C5B46_00490 [Pseudomonadota bacterium]